MNRRLIRLCAAVLAAFALLAASPVAGTALAGLDDPTGIQDGR